MQSFILWSLYFLGEVPEMRRRVPRLVQEARKRGDLYALTNLRTEFVHVTALAADQPDVARAQVTDAMRDWTTEGFHLEHFWELHSHAQIDLYTGEAKSAYDRMQRAWRNLEWSMLLRIQQVRCECLYLRGRAALSAARGAGTAKERRLLVAQGRKDGQELLGEEMAWATPLGELLLASAAAPAERTEAVQRIERALVGLESTGMRLHAAAARRRLGELKGDQALVAEADRWLRERQIVDPARMTEMLTPSMG